MKRAALIIHPPLFAMFPVLFFFSHNIAEIRTSDISEVIASTLAATLFSLFLWLLTTWVFKNREKAGLVVSLFLLVFFSYGHIHAAARALAVVRIRYWLSLLGVLLLLAAHFIAKTSRGLHSLTKACNFAAIFLILVCVINIGRYELGRRFIRADANTHAVTVDADDGEAELMKVDIRPDIYYIIIDRYASQRTFREFFDYDNSEFIHYLTRKGFCVASGSKTNYLATHVSLASSLNMKHLDCLRGVRVSSMAIQEMLDDYRVWHLLKPLGYTFVHFGSWYNPTRMNRYADVNFNLSLPRYLRMGEFSAKLLQTTLLGLCVNPLARGVRTLQQLDELAEIPDLPGPKYVFIHMLVTHPPYMFDRDGNPLSGAASQSARMDKETYLNQVAFANQWAQRFVDRVLSRSSSPPIIMVQSDEGPTAEMLEEDEGVQLSKEEAFRMHAGILNAYYLPGVDTHLLSESISPVNSFRVIFNLYFGAHYNLLEDRTYISDESEGTFKFVDVTDAVSGRQ